MKCPDKIEGKSSCEVKELKVINKWTGNYYQDRVDIKEHKPKEFVNYHKPGKISHVVEHSSSQGTQLSPKTGYQQIQNFRM
ncbi:24042_t:CDS:2, partial [Gigaspora margarita]